MTMSVNRAGKSRIWNLFRALGKYHTKHSLRSKNKKLLSVTDLQTNLNTLNTFYKPMDLDPAFYKSKVVATKKLHFILTHCSRKDLQDQDFEDLLMCALTLVYFFGMRLKLNRLTSRTWYWCSRRQFNKAETAFQKTMDMLLPESSDQVIKITLNFFTTVQLWSSESFVEQILEVVLYFNRGRTTLFNLMLTDIHYVLFTDLKSARHRMRVFYGLLKSSHWVIDKQRLLPFVTRLLDFFAHSITKTEGKASAYTYLRKGFEVCLRRIFERVENQHRRMIITTMLNWFSLVNMKYEDILEFSTLLEHAALFYQVGSYKESFGEGLMEHVLVNLVGSMNSTYSLVGCRLLLRFLDRQRNSQYLIVPVIFYEFSQVRLKVNNVSDIKDKTFLRHHRDKLHNNLLKAIKCHCKNIVNLKIVFSIMCCILLEVPCGLTAAAAACLVMSIQDIALNGENIPAACRYWLHAVVVSIMSLICWVHKAPVLYTYVNQVISRRAKEAPQLNPPLMYFYKIGRHHVTWNKPSLFFEDWELRYALWKHFQVPQPEKISRDKLTNKAPSLDIN